MNRFVERAMSLRRSRKAVALVVGILTAVLLGVVAVAQAGGLPRQMVKFLAETVQSPAAEQEPAPSVEPPPIPIVEAAETVSPFSIKCSPGRFPAGENNGGANSCTVMSRGGFSAAVELSCENTPPVRFWCDFSPKQVTPAPGGSASFHLQLRPDDVVVGSYRFLVVGTSGALRSTYSFPFKVLGQAGGTYTVSCENMSPKVLRGQRFSETCTVVSHHGLTSPVTLSCRQPEGIPCGFSPATVIPPAYGSITTIFFIDVPKSTKPGAYTFFVDGQNKDWSYPGAVLPINAAVLAPSFEVKCNPSSISDPADGEATFSCTVTSRNGFDSAVTMDCNPSNQNIDCLFEPDTVTPPPDGSITTTLSVDVYGMSPGTYRIDVLGNASGFVVGTHVDVVVTY